ncbi:MAG: hypothetical protein WAJ97_07715 [Terriglobales bacterium]|jgi:hypothetical protein
MKNFSITLILALMGSLHASAAITEIRKEFPNQTAALPATAILSAPGSDASYLLCVYLSQLGSSNSLSVILKWTDENSKSRSFTFSAAQGVISNCDPIRILAHTAPKVETSGSYVGTYDLYVVGFGFWMTGSQGQGGITEPFANWHLTSGPITLLSPVGAATYLVAADCADGAASTLNWIDEVGSQSITVSPSLNGAFVPVHVAASKSLVFASGSCYLSVVNMGTPKLGSGPLTDYEVDLLNYTDVKWPNYVPVVTAGPTTTYVFAGNIAQVPNSAGRVLELLGDRLFLQILYADENGAPGNNAGTDLTFPFGIVGAGYRSGNPNNPFTFNITTAINDYSSLGWGASPKYSAEVDVIQF